MAFILKPYQIALHTNTDAKNEKAPTLRGEANIGGCIVPVALWTNTTRDGKKWWLGHVGTRLMANLETQQTNTDNTNNAANVPYNNHLPF